MLTFVVIVLLLALEILKTTKKTFIELRSLAFKAVVLNFFDAPHP